MFRSQAMLKVEIVVPEHDIVAVTEALAGSESFHVASSSDSSGRIASQSTEGWDESARRFAALEQRLTKLMQALDIDDGMPTDVELHWISESLAERDIDSLEREAQEPVDQLNEAHRKLEELVSLYDQMAPLEGLSVEIEAFRSAGYVFSMFGYMPSENVDRLRTSLEQIPSVVLTVGERGHLAMVGLFGLMRDVEVLRRAARSAYLNALSVPSEYRGTPREVAESLRASIDRTRERIASYQRTIHQLQETRIRRLRHLVWRIRASRHLCEAIAGFAKFKYTYLVPGWVPKSRLDDLEKRVSAASEHALLKTSAPRADERAQVPFLFNNPPGVRLFEQLVKTYSTPNYSELDPTPLLALTFPLVFGVMFGDVGHGLVLLLLGLFLMRSKLKALQQFSQFGGIVLLCGIVSMVFGVLYGSVFGFEQVLPALWLRPLEQTQEILVITVLFGVATLSLGMILHMLESIQHAEWADLLLSHSGVIGLVFYLALVGLGASVIAPSPPVSLGLLLPVATISGFIIMFAGLLRPLIDGEATDHAAAGMSVVEGFFELFELLISLMSNTLSYVRIGAFAVAHGALSLVVVILGELVSPERGVGFWVVVLLGNLFVIGFEGMIVAIQTLRLEYYEFFSKFFTGGGVPFRPLTMLSTDQVSS